MASVRPSADKGSDPDAATRILGVEGARAYRRFLEWSVGEGFKMAVIEVATPKRRDALVAWTFASYPRACRVALDAAEETALIPFLEQACSEREGGVEVLLLTRLDEARDRIKLCTRLNVQRDELSRTFPVPWVVLVHPSTALDLQRHAPDFSDFVSLWLREEAEEAEDIGALRGTSAESYSGDASRIGAAEDIADLLSLADKALVLSRFEEVEDLIARYDLRHPEARAQDPWRMQLEAELLSVRGQPGEALSLLKQALQRCEAIGDTRRRATLLRGIAAHLHRQGEVNEASRLLQTALALVGELDDVHARAEILGPLADIVEARGQLDEALRIRQQEELPVYEQLGDIHGRAITLSKIADIFAARGQLDEALRIQQQEALPIFETLGDVRSRAIALSKIADIFKARGQLNEALRLLQQETLPIYEKLGDIRSRAVALIKVADIFAARGQLDEALRLLQQEVLPVYATLGDIRTHAVTLGRIANIFAARGQLDEALRLMQQEELPVYEKLGAARDLLVGRVNLALLYLKRDHPRDRETAAELLRLALKAAEELRIPDADEIRKIQRKAGLAPPAEGGA